MIYSAGMTSCEECQVGLQRIVVCGACQCLLPCRGRGFKALNPKYQLHQEWRWALHLLKASEKALPMPGPGARAGRGPWERPPCGAFGGRDYTCRLVGLEAAGFQGMRYAV